MKNKNIFILQSEDINKIGDICLFPYGLNIAGKADIGYPIQYVYITSDEEIKRNDYTLYLEETSVSKVNSLENELNKEGDYFKKIILTTDEDLIKDGVQAIDDTFLEWFVKNPNCEKVKIMKLEKLYAGIDKYEIIIPEEEPSWKELENIIAEKMLKKADVTVTLHKGNVLTTEELKYPIGGYAPGNYMCNCTTCKTSFQGDKRAVQCEPCAVKMVEEQSQLLIENDRISAEKEQNRVEWITMMHKQNLNGRETEDELFEAGVRAGIEESYSEEEVLEILYKVGGWTMPDVEEWFEKHKKI